MSCWHFAVVVDGEVKSCWLSFYISVIIYGTGYSL